MQNQNESSTAPMDFGLSIVRYSIDHPKQVTAIMIILAILFMAFMPMVKVDTDPENMLAEDEAVRVFHNQMKKEFSLYDMVVLGIVNEEHPDGVFNPETLSRIYELTQFAKTLQWPDPNNPDKQIGVINADLLAPSTVDNIEQAGLGTVRFEWLMSKPPKTREEALNIRDNALDNPLLRNTLVSEDGKALCLYLPLDQKDLSYRVYSALKEKISEFSGDERYFITGLPVAEDTFGVEMFIQMAISAPLAMLVIFLLMLYFFRKLILIISPMIVAMVSVIYAMGLLIATGNTVHIMSSMIPIFVMPIAVLDSIHIISDFFDRYPRIKDRRKTSLDVMRHLFVPMLYTSLTSAAGFASLALTPIPPVQVFGIFVAFGVLVAWFLTITFIPAFTMFIKESSLENFGIHENEESPKSRLTSFLRWIGGVTYAQAKLILTVTLIIVILAIYGISKIQINDNPVKWFTEGHPIRVADRVLNEHFGGTYMAYLAVEPAGTPGTRQVQSLAEKIKNDIHQTVDEQKEGFPELVNAATTAISLVDETAQMAEIPSDFIDSLTTKMEVQKESAEGFVIDAWDELIAVVERAELSLQTFKRPDVLKYIAQIQDALLKTDVVGKSNSVVDIVKKVHKELFEGDEAHYTIPDTAPAVAQTLISFQNSHNPDDLWHMVTPNYDKASIWVQLKSGDNKDMEKVVQAIEKFFKNNPPPTPLQHQWFGKTYLNIVWQDKMVSGMLEAFLGSFIIVFLMMTVLFSSPLWGLLSMIPLTVTIGFIYGLIGYIGKDYDMPVAVLSSLTLGLAIDFAIHFLARGRAMVLESKGRWGDVVQKVFAEPARAITRNVIVIAVGFLPLLAAPLVPYKTVGVFIATILAVSGIGTLLILPALVTVLEKWLFRETAVERLSCNCVVCITTSVLAVLFIAINLHQFFEMSWSALTWLSVVLIPVMVVSCSFLSRRTACKIEQETTTKE